MTKTTRVLAVSCGIAFVSLSLGWAKDPQVKSKKEAESFQAMQQALQGGTPDSQLKAIEDFLGKFADTDFKVLLLTNAMQIAQQKRDTPLTITYAERVIEVDPKNFEPYITMAAETANGAKEFDLDKAEKTAKVQKWAQTGLENVKTYPKPFSQLPEDQWAQQKATASAQAHGALAMMAQVNKKMDDAIGEFKLAIDSAPDPVMMFRLGEAYMKASKWDESTAAFDKVVAAADAPAQVKQYAQQRKVEVAKMKAAAAK